MHSSFAHAAVIMAWLTHASKVPAWLASLDYVVCIPCCWRLVVPADIMSNYSSFCDTRSSSSSCALPWKAQCKHRPVWHQCQHVLSKMALSRDATLQACHVNGIRPCRVFPQQCGWGPLATPDNQQHPTSQQQHTTTQSVVEC